MFLIQTANPSDSCTLLLTQLFLGFLHLKGESRKAYLLTILIIDGVYISLNANMEEYPHKTHLSGKSDYFLQYHRQQPTEFFCSIRDHYFYS
jgi:hypothetical protein